MNDNQLDNLKTYLIQISATIINRVSAGDAILALDPNDCRGSVVFPSRVQNVSPCQGQSHSSGRVKTISHLLTDPSKSTMFPSIDIVHQTGGQPWLFMRLASRILGKSFVAGTARVDGSLIAIPSKTA
jgi:hypothetical protein